MNIYILSSGSKGNATLIESKNAKILIDIGISLKKLEEKLKEININPAEIEKVLITHEHGDHINGLKALVKKYKTPVLFPDTQKKIKINDFQIDSIRTSHDVENSFGFIIKNKEKEIVYITDTGYINKKYFDKLKNKNSYIIESNHDIEMLMKNKYPYYLKQRIIGDKGHLSNKDAAFYINKFIGEKTRDIILVHLSEESNTQEIAKKEMVNKIKNKKIKVSVCTQNKIKKIRVN